MGRVALVTGGTRGIGAAVAEALSGAGHRVAASYVGNQEAAEAFHRRTGIAVYRWDVADYAACEAGVRQVEAELGPIEILVNNAGIAPAMPLHRMSAEDWHKVIETDLSSCFHMCRRVIEGMRARGFGRIVNMGSVTGQAGAYGLAGYAAAKAGLHGLTKSLALENASKGITVNTVAPGYIDTELVRVVRDDVLERIIAAIPVRRLGRPEEVARAVLFLVDDEAGFITGSCLSINGGQHMY